MDKITCLNQSCGSTDLSLDKLYELRRMVVVNAQCRKCRTEMQALLSLEQFEIINDEGVDD